MPRPRSVMRKIREVLRLTFAEGLSRRLVGVATGVATTTVADYVTRAQRAGLGWPLPEGMDDGQLEARLFVTAGPPLQTRPQPDWLYVHREMRRPYVTLQLLHLEYREKFGDGYEYSQFCRLYRLWQRPLDVVMRQEHRAGEKLFVDFAGPTIPIVNPFSGEITQAQLFVAALGASNYMYAEALPSQELPHWIAAHVHTFEFLGVLPKVAVCDNLKAGVTKAHRFEPLVNATYLEMATHYGLAIIPARAYKPRDKAKIEVGVLIAERWILARLRHHTFFSLTELNVAIGQLLEWLNNRPFKKMPGSRRSLFEELERPVMRPLPAERYEYADWRVAKVNIDYHIEVDRHYYSVPYQLTGQQVEVRLAASTVEVFLRGRRVASHVRRYTRGYSTERAHMPESHRRHLEWTPSRIVGWAEKTGPSTAALVRGVMESRPHPEQGYRACLGIISLGRKFGHDRLEAASRRAVHIQAFSLHSVRSILKTGLDSQPLPTSLPSTPGRRHKNLRGATYYQ